MKHVIFFYFAFVFFLPTQGFAQVSFWKSMGLTNTFSPRLAVDSRGTLFAATSGSGLHRSTDEGLSWTQVPVQTFPWFNQITIAPNDDIYLAGVAALYRSTNNGQTWGYVVFGASYPSVNDVVTITSDTVFAATRIGVFKSVDRGFSWQASSQGLPSESVLSLTTDSSNNLFAGFDREGIFFSSNGGIDWQPRRVGIEREVVYDIETDPTGDIFLATLNGVYKSRDAGLNWASLNSGVTNKSAHSLAIELDGTAYVGTLGGGVFVSKNRGLTWDSLSIDLAVRHVMSLSIVQGRVVYAGTNTGGLYRLIKPGDSVIAPIPDLPANNAGQVVTTPRLSWARTVTADNYVLQVSTDSLFQGNGVSEFSTQELFHTLPPLNHSRRYYWRVFGANKYWKTIPSPTYSFMTIDPSAFTLMQNYPNPFNLQTTIHFSVPRPSTVHCNLYSITGQHVSTLFSQFAQPGDYRVIVNSTILSSGTYIYTLKSDNYFDVRKLTIIK